MVSFSTFICASITLVFILRTASVIVFRFLLIMVQIILSLSSVSRQPPILLFLEFLIIWILVEIVQTSLKRPVRKSKSAE